MRVLDMKDSQWQELDFSDFEDEEQFEKKKNKVHKKRKWREIEAYKEQQRERKFMDMNDHYYSM
jgi:hypothetical protein